MDITVKLTGGTDKFVEFLTECGCNVQQYQNINQLLNDTKPCNAIFFLPDYKNGHNIIEQVSPEDMNKIAILKNENAKMYFENYMSYNFYQGTVLGYEILGDVNHITTEVLIADNLLANKLNGDVIFQARRRAFFPSISRLEMDAQGEVQCDGEIMLRIGKHTGTSKTMDEINNDIAVLYRSKGIYSCLIPLSDYSGISMLPYSRYAELFSILFGEILSIEQSKVKNTFLKVFSRIKTRKSCHDKIDELKRESYIKSTVESAVKWHFDSGIIRDENGKSGTFEMIMSSSGELYKNFRVDAGLYTGWLLSEAGEYFNDEHWKKCGRTIYDYYTQRAQIDSGTHKGMFKWYVNPDSGPRQAYSIDCGRCGISLVNMYRLTKDEKYLTQIRDLADGFMNWFSEELLYSNFFWFSDDHSKDEPYKQMNVVCTPGVYAEVVSFMTMASDLLEDDKYAKQCILLADKLCSVFPDFETHGHTTSSKYSRYLLLLTAAHSTGLRDYSEMINYLIEYLSSLQTSCGGIYVEDNLSFKEYSGRSGEVTENGINAPWEDVEFSDQLYCMNNIITAFTAIKHMKYGEKINKELAQKTLISLEDYLMKIQICNSGNKYDGGWMRAYDMTHDEYYGMDLDLFWGPYCIMAGWIMGIIPIAFLSELNNKSYYIYK